MALGLVCTDPGTRTFTCPCHGSVYSEAGLVVRGPAFSPLRCYPTEFTASAIAATIP